jgi:hypothetical protein
MVASRSIFTKLHCICTALGLVSTKQFISTACDFQLLPNNRAIYGIHRHPQPFSSSIHPSMALQPLPGLGLPRKRLHSPVSSALLLHPIIPSSCTASLWTTSAHLFLGLPTGILVILCCIPHRPQGAGPRSNTGLRPKDTLYYSEFQFLSIIRQSFWIATKSISLLPFFNLLERHRPYITISTFLCIETYHDELCFRNCAL